MQRDEERPVFLLRDLPKWVKDGGEIHIRCLETPTRIGPNLSGLWRIYAVADGRVERVLCAVNSVAPRDFRTFAVLYKLAYNVGFKRFEIPMRKGDQVCFKRADFLPEILEGAGSKKNNSD